MSVEPEVVEAASTAFNCGDLKACVDIAARGVREAREQGKEADVWRLRCLLAQCYGVQGRFQEALLCVEEGDEHKPATPDIRVQLMIHRAFYLTQLGNYALAKRTLDEAASLVHAEGKPTQLSEIYVSRMTLFFYLADYDRMEESAHCALVASEGQDAALTEAWAASGVGKSLMVRSRFPEAIKWYERAHSIFVREGSPFHAAQMRSELGCCYYGLGEDERALECFVESLKASLNADGMPGYQINLANIGNIHLRRGEYAAAISSYQQALEIARKLGDQISVSKWLNNLALTYQQMGNLELAERFRTEADQVARKVDAARALAAS